MRIEQYHPYTAASRLSRTGDERNLGSARRSASRAFGTIARPRAVGATSPNERSSARARKAEAREHPVNRMIIRSRSGSLICPSNPARSTSCAVFPRHLASIYFHETKSTFLHSICNMCVKTPSSAWRQLFRPMKSGLFGFDARPSFWIETEKDFGRNGIDGEENVSP